LEGRCLRGGLASDTFGSTDDSLSLLPARLTQIGKYFSLGPGEIFKVMLLAQVVLIDSFLGWSWRPATTPGPSFKHAALLLLIE
jgi:hypothetical protein